MSDEKNFFIRAFEFRFHLAFLERSVERFRYCNEMRSFSIDCHGCMRSVCLVCRRHRRWRSRKRAGVFLPVSTLRFFARLSVHYYSHSSPDSSLCIARAFLRSRRAAELIDGKRPTATWRRARRILADIDCKPWKRRGKRRASFKMR